MTAPKNSAADAAEQDGLSGAAIAGVVAGTIVPTTCVDRITWGTPRLAWHQI